MIATKEQERNTLEKIKKMVAEHGTASYLAAVFTVAFELAEQNIENLRPLQENPPHRGKDGVPFIKLFFKKLISNSKL